jgi:prepilin-type processing-associated H-X9-DG protein
MGRVHRRTAIKGLALLGGAATAGACTTPRAPAPASSARPSAQPRATAFTLRTQRLHLARGSERPLPTSIWRPTAAGDYPLILFSHGLGATPHDYEELLTGWARAGFVVAAPAYPHTTAGVADFNPVDVFNQPADASYVITQVVQRLGITGPIAAAGHSAGGVTTLGLFASRDDRLEAGVVLAGRQIFATPLTGSPAPLLFVHGRRDKTIAYADGHAAYDAVTWPKAFLTVTDGGHTTTGRELDVVERTSTDFWRWSLYRDAAAESRLTADATGGKLATLEVDLRR